jgi:hypothetical protein
MVKESQVMKGIRSFGALLFLVAASMDPVCALANWRIPAQIELRVPFEPTAYTSGGRAHLTYELYVTNFSASAMDLRRIEVLDAAASEGKPIATFEGEQIDSMLQDVGGQSASNKPSPRVLNAGATAVVFMQVDLDTRALVPNNLRHRLVTADDSIEGAVVSTHRTEIRVLAPPVRGTHWHAYDGPSNDRENHHRRGILVLDGRPSISRRFATDWFLTDGKIYKWHRGDAHEKKSYYSYGQSVFAVGDGTIVAARDGMPDNYPGPVENFRRAVPLTFETASGNMIVIDLGGGVFAHYAHLQPGSLRVKTGDRVHSGDVLARIGVSGDPNVPHLHFEVTTSAKLLAGEGVPYAIDQYRAKTPDGAWKTFTSDLPSRNMLVAFGPADEPAK